MEQEIPKEWRGGLWSVFGATKEKSGSPTTDEKVDRLQAEVDALKKYVVILRQKGGNKISSDGSAARRELF